MYIDVGKCTIVASMHCMHLYGKKAMSRSLVYMTKIFEPLQFEEHPIQTSHVTLEGIQDLGVIAWKFCQKDNWIWSLKNIGQCLFLQQRYAKIIADPSYVDGILAEGAIKANEIANKTLKDVYDAMGFMPPKRT